MGNLSSPRCLDCGEDVITKPKGLSAFCTACVRLHRLTRNFAHGLKRWHNMTVEEYMVIWKTQKGRCAICGIPENKLVKRLAVDHNHKTGNKRGLLCIKCNNAIGALDEDLERFASAVSYLKKWSEDAERS